MSINVFWIKTESLPMMHIDDSVQASIKLMNIDRKKIILIHHIT